MTEPVPDTAQLQRWIHRLREGNGEAPNELIRHACGRLERLVRKMLRDDPRVHRWEDTGDVLQAAFIRLLRALQTVTPASRQDFFALATLQIRREILDLARHYFGAHGEGANHASTSGEVDAFTGPSDLGGEDPSRLAEWTEFHEAIARLPEKERAVFELRYYHGHRQKEIAEVLGIDVSTVERRWRSAVLLLKKEVGGAVGEMN